MLAPFAISPIIARFALPALIGALLFGAGYAVLFFVYCPILLFDDIRSSLSKTK